MKKYCFILVLVISYLMTISTALADVPNPSREILGNSLAEKKIIWAWKHRFDFIKACAMTDCAKAEPLKTNLPKLAAISSATSDDQLQFKSETANPGFFSSNLGESNRIAITGRTPGSPIYFNTDLIKDLSLENIVALLFHEWSHHLGLNDDNVRIPDQVGALMAKDFTANLLYSPFSGSEGYQLVSAVFQFPVPKDSLQERFFYTDFAFFTDGVMLLDTDLAKFDLYPACDKPDFSLAGQVTQTPHWRDLGIVDGKNKVRLTITLVNACYQKNAAGQLSDYHYARRGYRFDLELSTTGLLLPSSEEALSDALQADLDSVSTLEFVSIKYSKTQLNVGDDLNISIQVKSYTNLNPQTCSFGISNEGAPLQGGGFPVVSQAPACKVTIIGDNLWEISTSLKINADMISGNYFPRMIKVDGDGKPNSAILVMPEQNGFKVVNNNLTKAFSISSVSASSDLKAITKFGNNDVSHSYSYQPGQKIEVRINVNTNTAIHIKGLAIYTMTAVNNRLQAVQNSGGLSDFAAFNMQQKTLDVGPNLKTVVLTFTIPDSWNNNRQFGMSLQGIYIEDEAFQQVAWKASGPWDYMFIDSRLLEANR